ncbi:hypothetical protein [Sphingomonas oligophenolica]|uniref:Helix-turn-helix domain-containing protein n=1 Tax=Sphingomonas oligophenolica TaxID=301154 RepID=A0A502CND4_9SPHN|nr:hypothetical protein [Sphingomonas oligophenolica]TPG13201.1 hypothetical protein EAH84_07325 [Sphingomonas oligophenolica]
MISAKDIVVDVTPLPATAMLATDAPRHDVDAKFQRLRQLKEGFPTEINKHDRVLILISACVDEGFVTGPRITGAIAQLGFNRQHAGIMLQEGCGQRWIKDEKGNFLNLL